MTVAYGGVHDSKTQIHEHVEVGDVGAKRVLLAGYDGTNLNDVNIDSEGNVSITFDKNNDLPRIKSTIEAIRSCIGIAADLRVTILSGAVTSVSTLTNITNVGSVPAHVPMNALMNLAYIQSNSNNIA
jgi:hypothetical protein